MRRPPLGGWLRVAVALAVTGAFGCSPSELGPSDNPTPIVTATDPGSLPRGTAPVTVTVLGLGFMDGAEARWNGAARPTTWESDTRLAMEVTAQDLEADAGDIDVVNPPPGGGASDPFQVFVVETRPAITALVPSQIMAVVTSTLTLQVTGTGFIITPPGSVLHWDGVALPTDVASATSLSATVPDYLLRVGRTAQITVRSPNGGGTSLPSPLPLTNPTPVVASIDPSGVPEDRDAVVDIVGTGFAPGASVLIGATRVAPQVNTGTRLTLEVDATLAVGGSTPQVRVENPAPGGGTSNGVPLAVWNDPPRIDLVVPAQVFAGGDDFTLSIVGADFDVDATVTLNGTVHATTLVSATRIELHVENELVVTEGTIEIRVTNPSNGAVASEQLLVLGGNQFSAMVVGAAWGGGFIRASLLDGTNAFQVTAPGDAYRVDAAPNGPMAAYAGNGRIFEVDVTTGEQRRVTPVSINATVTGETWPRYSDDGVWVYFGGSRSGGRTEIWRVRRDGTSPLPVVQSTSSLAYAAPSHAGDRVAYIEGSSGGNEFGALRVYNLVTQTSTPLNVQALTSRWSPDDNWIVYLAPNWELRRIRPDGSGQQTLVTSIDVGHCFDFDAAGAQLIATDQNGAVYRIAYPAGTVSLVSAIGQNGCVAWFGP